MFIVVKLERMKTRLILTVTLFFLCLHVNSQGLKVKPYYDRQFGIETGLGGAGEKNVPFLFGVQFGSFYRIKNHQFGVRLSRYSRLKIYYNEECLTANAFYGFVFSSHVVSITPQVGVGYFRNEEIPRSAWSNYNLEAALEFACTKVGNGLYIRPFCIWNRYHTFLGLTLGGRFGYAWNKKKEVQE